MTIQEGSVLCHGVSATAVYFGGMAEPTRSAEHEYAIYMIKDDSEPKRLADTFLDWVNNFCLQVIPEIDGDDFVPTFESGEAVVGL